MTLLATLAIPAITGQPQQLQGTGADDVAVRAGLALLDAGYGHATRPRRSPLEHDVVIEGLHEWIHRQCQGLRYLSPSIQAITRRVDRDGHPPLTISFGDLIADDYLGTVWELAPRWRAIERRAPGLGPTILLSLDRTCTKGFPLCLPSTLLHLASGLYWGGYLDETNVLAELEADGENPEDLDILRRGDFDTAIPRHVSRPKPTLKPSQLERLARRHTDEGRIAALLLKLHAATRVRPRRGADHEFWPHVGDDDGNEACGFAALLRWNERDPAGQILDDYIERASQMSSASMAWFWFDFEPERIAGWMKAMEQRFAVARLVDQLLPLIARRVDR